MIKLQYQGMNLLDQIATVEIAVDEYHNTIHLYDPESVVWPEYRGVTSGYVLSDGFEKMLKVLESKPFFVNWQQQNESNGLCGISWIFYKQQSHILKSNNEIVNIMLDYKNQYLNVEFLEKIQIIKK